MGGGARGVAAERGVSSAGAKVAVVTGASRGIGRAVAEALVPRGVSVCICARDEATLREAARSLGPKVLPVVADVSSQADVDRLFERCRAEFGPVDWLVNNAGIAEEQTPIDRLVPETWNAVIATNLTGAFLCTRAALPDLRVRRGRVVNVSSMAGQGALPEFSAYVASKWGLNGLTVTLAEELRGDGVMVAAVLPSSVDTAMLRRAGFPPRRHPSEVAEVIVELLAEAPFSATGSLVEVS